MDIPLLLTQLGADATLSHESAARRHGLPLLQPGGECVTLGRNRSRRTVPGWQVHRHDLAARDVAEVDDVRCTAVLRTLFDLARSRPLAQGLAAADSAVRTRKVTVEQVRAHLGAATGRGARGARTVAALVSADSDSVLESALAALLHEHGFLRPRRQYQVSEVDGTLVAQVDVCWPEQRLIVEADGFEFHSDRSSYRRDRDRLNALVRLDWRVLRFAYEHVLGRPQHVVGTIRACLTAHPAPLALPGWA